MKKVGFILTLAAFIATGCSSDEEFTPSYVPYVIDAEVEDFTSSTRTTLDNDGRSIFWDTNDSLSVFLGGDIMNCAVIYGTPEGRSAKFIVEGKFIIGGTTDDEGFSYTNVALYPYNKSAALIDNDTVSTIFPAKQKAVVNSIPNGVPMVAEVGNVSTTSFTFKNVCSFIRFSLSSPVDVAISSIVLTSGVKPVTGDLLVDVTTANYKMGDTTGNNITLDCNGVALNTTPTTLFMALLPVEFGDDEWSVELFDANGGSMKFILPAFTFERNTFYTLNVNYVPAT